MFENVRVNNNEISNSPLIFALDFSAGELNMDRLLVYVKMSLFVSHISSHSNVYMFPWRPTVLLGNSFVSGREMVGV